MPHDIFFLELTNGKAKKKWRKHGGKMRKWTKKKRGGNSFGARQSDCFPTEGGAERSSRARKARAYRQNRERGESGRKKYRKSRISRNNSIAPSSRMTQSQNSNI